MTLGRLLLAWVPAAAWFLAARWAGLRIVEWKEGGPEGGEASGEGTFPAPAATRVWTAGWTIAEAGVVTLFASLWFDSLGSGGWWLLFLLVGLLAAFPIRLQRLPTATVPRRTELLLAVTDTVRYLGAGALLAWRLGS